MYDEFSQIYDYVMSQTDYENYYKNIKKHIADKKIGSVLELGIGTGNMTEFFYSDDLSYTGYDISSQMIQICKNKFPRLDLHCEDISEADFKGTYDLVFTSLDTFNYILDPDKLAKLFINLSKVIDDGYLVFDINTPYKLISIMGNNHFVYEDDDIFYTWVNQYYEEDNLIDFYIDFFVKEGDLYRRIHEEQTQKVYSLDSLKFMLYNAGFNNIEIYDYDKGEVLSDQALRALFIVKK